MSRFHFTSILFACALLAAALPVFANPWSDAGVASRPAWVLPKTERRLNMLAALPGIASTLQSQATGYFANNGPGMSVGLVLDDGLYYSQGFGFADAAKSTAPDEFTVFRAGSLSKVITGTALLTLIDDPARNMALTDAADLPQYLPELKFVCPLWQQSCARGSQNTGIKLRHLVSHTAGLANVMEQTNAGIATWLGDLKKSWLLFSPGNAGAYSGVSIEGVGLIEARVSGLSYPAFVKANLFDPLGMTHSSMDPLLPEPLTAQKWQWSATNSTWSFALFNSIIGGDDQPMILPAGGLATNVSDLARFIGMWLSGAAPTVNGHPLLKATTISNAKNSMFPPALVIPAFCSGAASKDANGFSYSRCGQPFGFGVSWYVGQAPYLQHNGAEPGVSGSNTLVNQAGKIGATGLISTEPFPVHKLQPGGLDGNFMGTVVSGLMNAGVAADAATDWTGKTLAIGTARVLWLSGKVPAASDLGAFTPAFVAAQNLDGAKLVALLTKWQATFGKCKSFRVRKVNSATQIAVAFQCAKKDFFTTLTVEAEVPHRIAWTTPLATPPAPSPQCKIECNKQEGICMAQAHSTQDKQGCIADKKMCLQDCVGGQ